MMERKHADDGGLVVGTGVAVAIGDIHNTTAPNRTSSRIHFCHELLKREDKRTVKPPVPDRITLAALISRYLFVVEVFHLSGIVQNKVTPSPSFLSVQIIPVLQE